MVPGSDVTVEAVGVNPTRTGFLDVLRRMGADLEVRERAAAYAGEPVADIRAPVRAACGRPRLPPEEVPRLIDELPLVGLVATAAEGVTHVRGAGELRVKESDRIAGLVAGLRALGADVDERPDGFLVDGPSPLHGAEVDSLTDHRLAMTFAVAGLIASGPVHVTGLSYVGGFLSRIRRDARGAAMSAGRPRPRLRRDRRPRRPQHLAAHAARGVRGVAASTPATWPSGWRPRACARRGPACGALRGE